MRQAWTTSEQRWLAGLAPTHTVAELSEKLERSKGAIVSQLNLMGITAKPQKKAWMQREVKLVETMLQHFSYEDIARELGRSSASVRSFVRMKGVESRYKVWNPTREQIDEVARLRQERRSLNEICHLMGCTTTNLRSLVKNEKIKRGIGYETIQRV